LISLGDLWQDLQVDFIVVETNIVILTFGVVLPFVNV